VLTSKRLLVIAAVSYAINNNSTSSASGPSATGAGSSTVGQGTGTSSAPGTPAAPSGASR
jgi:hypothetical protein